jgi:hypothetical protein
MISEGNRTHLVLGGQQLANLNQTLEKDFYTDPSNPFKLLPREGRVYQTSGSKWQFRNTKITILSTNKQHQVILEIN